MSFSKLDIINKALGNIESKAFKVLFYVPEHENIASAAIAELYNFAAVLRADGYNASLLVDGAAYEAPTFLTEEHQKLPHVAVDGAKFSVGPEDYLIVPEYFTNIMEQVKDLPCTKIVFAQSYDNIIAGLLAGMTWRNFNFTKVITTSDKMADFIEEYHGAGTYEIVRYRIGVPSYFCNAANKIRKPVIPFLVRNTADIAKLNKLFYLQNPDLTWVVFEDLRGKTKLEFAETLKNASVMVWMDRIASFGTTPLEAMASGTVTVGLLPELPPDYMKDGRVNGVWCNNAYDMSAMLGNAVRAAITNGIPSKMREDMAQTAGEHTQQASDETIRAAFGKLVGTRRGELEKRLRIAEKAQSLIVYEDDEEEGSN